MSGGVRKRKIRSDKKRDVQPTISIELKDCIYRLSYIVDLPVKDIAEELCRIGVSSKTVISHLSESFKRDVRIDNTLYIGDSEIQSNRIRGIKEKSERISIRFKSNMHNMLSVLSYALDCSIARACGMLLEASVRDSNIVNHIIKERIESSLDDFRMGELKKVYKYINSKNPYSQEATWAEIISYLFNETKIGISRAGETVGDFIVDYWRDEK